MSLKFSIIVAVDSDFGIGKNGQIPWQISADMKHFKEVTTTIRMPGRKNVVIMGRRTWESLPERFRPLPDRINLVITSRKDIPLPQGVQRVSNLLAAFDLITAQLSEDVAEIFVIGGAQVYKEAVQHPACQRIYLTFIQKSYGCDAFFPRDLIGFKKISESPMMQEDEISFCFQEHSRR
jgi:dihydrofolate reductase